MEPAGGSILKRHGVGRVHFRAGLNFTGQFPGWCEVENLPGFGVGEALDHAREITKNENHRKWKSQIESPPLAANDSIPLQVDPVPAEDLDAFAHLFLDHFEMVHFLGRDE